MTAAVYSQAITAMSSTRWNDRAEKSRRGEAPAAQGNRGSENSGFDGVAALSIGGLGRSYSQGHLLAQRAGQEAANRVGLPVCGFHQFGQGGAAGPLQQVQDFGRLGTCAGTHAGGWLGRLHAFFGLGSQPPVDGGAALGAALSL